MDNVWDVIKREAPTRIDELVMSLNVCATNITAVRALLRSKAQKYDKLDQLDEAMQVMNANREMLQIENYLKEVMNNFNNSEPTENNSSTVFTEKNIEDDEDEIEEELADERIDYTQYLVDQSIPYKLAEDFKNTSPYAFSFDGEKYFVDNWYEITIKVCEILYKKNAKLFSDIVGSCAIKGRKNAYIAFENEYPAGSIGVPKKLLDTNIIIEQRLSANQHMIVVKRLLDKFRLSQNIINIYLESDRKPKHGQIPIGKFLNGNMNFNKKKLNNETEYKSVDSQEKKIGEYARDFFTVYFSNKAKQYNLNGFLNKNWCNEHLGICYPLLKEIDISKPIAEQKNYNNEYARYWIKPILEINGKHYIMCSQWFKGFQEKLDKWIDEGTVKDVTEYKQQRLFPKNYKRDKRDCIHYDFKKNQCMCTQSDATFTMSCNNVNTCNHYTQFALHIIPKQYCKRKHCPYCNSSLDKEFVYCTYRPDDETEIQNKLISYRCKKCDTNYVADTVYKGYTHSKSLENLNITFVKEDLG